MTSLVEAAFQNIQTVLATRAAQGDDVLPAPVRNAVMLANPDSKGRFLNVVDGDSIPRDEALAGTGAEQEFELAVLVEWSIGQKTTGAADADFDAGLVAIADATGQTAGGDRTLGGLVDHIRLMRVTRTDLALDGFPSIKATVLEFRILMTAPSLIG